ncbi:unnamed protein product [Paramecium pentaurelia]|uniref:Uncharacterized protein n=1 Tax=Paramecium pentaurelia TaxID=43138 RepID=A0A8S1WIS3_9CILI|nr:unnamed protein product [Paramecium pentaurelia]
MQQLDCLTDNCYWDADSSICTNKPCSEFSQSDCQILPDPFNCIWNYTTNKCENFTKCSDYSFNIDKLSLYKNCFWYQTPDGTQCVQNTEQQICESKLINKCSDYITNESCNSFACYWSDFNIFTEITCSILQQDNYFMYLSVDSKSVKLCQWTGNACVDLDVSTLTQTQCLTATDFTYGWNMDTQRSEVFEPPDISSSSYIILLEAIILVILIN